MVILPLAPDQTIATSAHVEDLFSTNGLFMRPHRACMGNKLLSELVMIKANLH